MKTPLRPSVDLLEPKVVGVAMRLEDLEYLDGIDKSDAPLPFDIAEIRLDQDEFFKNQKKVAQFLRACTRWPIILTPRHRLEGGANTHLYPHVRSKLLLSFIKYPCVWAVDVEVQHRSDVRKALRKAKGAGIQRIASFHDLRGTPNLHEVEKIKVSAFADEDGADIFKLAASANDSIDLSVLMQILERESDRGNQARRLSVMSIGKLSWSSRPLLAECGSVLNYGFIKKPFMVKQWPAEKLRRVLNLLKTSGNLQPIA